MVKDYQTLAQSVVKLVGGKENISALTHCMTRLRFVLHSQDRVDVRRLKSVQGVMGVVDNGDKIQVIVGNEVSYAYKEIMAICDLSCSTTTHTPTKKEKLTVKAIGAKMLDALVGTMSPLIPAIIGGRWSSCLLWYCR